MMYFLIVASVCLLDKYLMVAVDRVLYFKLVTFKQIHECVVASWQIETMSLKIRVLPKLIK